LNCNLAFYNLGSLSEAPRTLPAMGLHQYCCTFAYKDGYRRVGSLVSLFSAWSWPADATTRIWTRPWCCWSAIHAG